MCTIGKRVVRKFFKGNLPHKVLTLVGEYKDVVAATPVPAQPVDEVGS
jgi:hypothetical protein